MATERLTITSETSYEDLLRIVADNKQWETRCDIVMCQNYIDAAGILLEEPLSEMDESGTRVRSEVTVNERELQRARDWLHTELACASPPRQFIPARKWRG